MRKIERHLAAHLGYEAKEIGEKGKYISHNGVAIDIRDTIRGAVEGTVSYPPDFPFPEKRPGFYNTVIEARNESCLMAGRRLAKDGFNPVVLNFASGTHPGGGFLHGSRGQEETIVRSSCLFQCIRNNPMYPFNREHYDQTYSDYAIYSPAVPIFRDETGSLLENPYCLGFITAPAVNVRKLPLNRHTEIGPVMQCRINRVLSIGLKHGHDAIVLGAFGCGSFRNNPSIISQLFKKALTENFHGSYRHISFAVLDWSDEKKVIGPFERVFQKDLS